MIFDDLLFLRTHKVVVRDHGQNQTGPVTPHGQPFQIAVFSGLRNHQNLFRIGHLRHVKASHSGLQAQKCDAALQHVEAAQFVEIRPYRQKAG